METFLNGLLIFSMVFGASVVITVGYRYLRNRMNQEEKELATKCHCDAPCNAFCDGEWPRTHKSEISKQPLKTYN